MIVSNVMLFFTFNCNLGRCVDCPMHNIVIGYIHVVPALPGAND